MIGDGMKQNCHVGGPVIGLQRRPAFQRRGVDYWKIKLRVARVQPLEQIERLVQRPSRPRADTVHLVDHDDRAKPQRQRLAGDKARLRHRAFDGVDQQQNRVDHRQNALDLAAEVGMAGRIDDVDEEIAPPDCCILRNNGDAPLFFQIVGIHHPDRQSGGPAERAGLVEELVHKGRLAMIDMGDDGDIAKAEGRVGH